MELIIKLMGKMKILSSQISAKSVVTTNLKPLSLLNFLPLASAKLRRFRGGEGDHLKLHLVQFFHNETILQTDQEMT
jgi:hypothetical protein